MYICRTARKEGDMHILKTGSKTRRKKRTHWLSMHWLSTHWLSGQGGRNERTDYQGKDEETNALTIHWLCCRVRTHITWRACAWRKVEFSVAEHGNCVLSMVVGYFTFSPLYGFIHHEFLLSAFIGTHRVGSVSATCLFLWDNSGT